MLMIKNITLSFIFLFSIATLFGQAPDFSVTDSKGNSHALYPQYLNEGKTVLLKIFYTSCPPCNQIAPHLEPLYQDWGAGEHEVQFIELSIQSFDDNQRVNNYKATHGTTFPAAGSEGGSLDAVAPYLNDEFGQFTGTPTFVVISPDGSVNFDISGFGTSGKIQALDEAIAATGAQKPVETGVQGHLANNASLKITPNPFKESFRINLQLDRRSRMSYEIYNILGAKVREGKLGTLEAGTSSHDVNPGIIKPGTYILRLKQDDIPLKSVRLIKR